MAMDSICSTTECAQQEPHCPWFLMGVVYPSAAQSFLPPELAWRNSPLRGDTHREVLECMEAVRSLMIRPLACSLNSFSVRSENFVMPKTALPPDSTLRECAFLTLSAKIPLRLWYSETSSLEAPRMGCP